MAKSNLDDSTADAIVAVVVVAVVVLQSCNGCQAYLLKPLLAAPLSLPS